MDWKYDLNELQIAKMTEKRLFACYKEVTSVDISIACQFNRYLQYKEILN